MFRHGVRNLSGWKQCSMYSIVSSRVRDEVSDFADYCTGVQLYRDTVKVIIGTLSMGSFNPSTGNLLQNII